MKFDKLTYICITLFLSCASPLYTSPGAALGSPARSTIKLNRFQSEFLKQINALRARGCQCGDVYMPPAGPITWNYQLENAAYLHAQDMSKNNYFDHTNLNGRTSKDRIIAQGYTIKGYKRIYYGENIGRGQLNITEIMNGWIKSPGHCRNLMNQNFREVGVAMQNYYWVQDFGGRM